MGSIEHPAAKCTVVQSWIQRSLSWRCLVVLIAVHMFPGVAPAAGAQQRRHCLPRPR